MDAVALSGLSCYSACVAMAEWAVIVDVVLAMASTFLVEAMTITAAAALSGLSCFFPSVADADSAHFCTFSFSRNIDCY